MKFLSSKRLAIYLIIALTFVCLLGALIPQLHISIQPGQLSELISQKPLMGTVHLLGLFDIFHSWWFYLLVLALMTNLVLCTAEGLSRVLKIHHRQNRRSGKEILTGMKTSPEITLPPVEAEDAARRWAGSFGSVRESKDDGATVYWSERGWWSRLGAYVIHMAILLIAIGALVGNLFGQRGHMNILEGTSENTVLLERQPADKNLLKLPFAIQCRTFEIELYPGTDRPKDFKSDLAVWQDGKQVLEKTIEVNDPLKYGGFRFFQSSYGSFGGKTHLKVQDTTNDKQAEFWAPDGQQVRIAGTDDMVKVSDYREDHMHAGPAVLAEITREGLEPQTAWLFLNAPDFDKTRQGRYLLSFHERQNLYFTSLSVQRDPGVPLVWLGCTILFAGLIMVYGFSHKRAAALLKDGGVKLAWWTNRDSGALSRKAETFVERISSGGNR